MARIAYMTKAKLPAEEQHVWDKLSNGRERLPLVTEILMYRPSVAKLSEDLSRAVRSETSLSRRVIEFVILLVARETNCMREWSVHLNQARNSGTSEEVIQSIAKRRAPEGFDADEKLLAAFTLQIIRTNRVNDETYKSVHAKLGDIGIVDLAELIGHYCGLATVMNVFEVEPHDDPALHMPM